VHEEVRRGTLAELAAEYAHREVKGEICLVVAGQPVRGASAVARMAREDDPARLVQALIAKGYGRKDALREAARQLGIARREVYNAVLKARRQAEDAST
jgi:16S rRNA (cytidine1402-2'-O)-methyltransferase